MKLTQNQKDLLACIKDKKIRKEVKKEFKKKITFYHTRWKLLDEVEPIVFENGKLETDNPKIQDFLSQHPLKGILFKEEFEKVNGKGFPWREHNVKEVEERFNELAKKYMPKEDVDTFKKEIQSMISADISHLTFTTELNNGNFVFYKDNHKPFEYSGKISEMTFSDKLAIVEKIESYAEELDVNLKPKGKFIIPK